MENKEAVIILKGIQNDIMPHDELSGQRTEDVAFSLAFKALEAQGWIPVSERLPDKMGSYITTINCGKYGFATGQRYFFNDEIGWNDKDVIAWMPLPEPYTKEDDNNAI